MKNNYRLTDVLTHIKADQCWQMSHGQGVTIAIVDTGICGEMAEFPLFKRSKFNWPNNQQAWIDSIGHGSMVACIAAANNSCGGRYNGVAPDATIISCQTNYDETNLYLIYNYLINLVESGAINRLVINNSYGIKSRVIPDVSETDLFPSIVRRAVSKGIVVVFPAGNNHVVRCGYHQTASGPNSIWGANSLDEVICVGTVNEVNTMMTRPRLGYGFGHRDSSRGPGHLSRNTIKPDCVAPTYGEVIWGNQYIYQEWWGTSGAAALVSGLVALILAQSPHITPLAVQSIIKETCTTLPLPVECVGAGLIDCYSALAKSK